MLGLTKLTPLLKDNGGIRPVAGGECLRKLVARALVREHREALLEAVGEHQFGAGRPGGAEILVHSVQAGGFCCGRRCEITEARSTF